MFRITSREYLLGGMLITVILVIVVLLLRDSGASAGHDIGNVQTKPVVQELRYVSAERSQQMVQYDCTDYIEPETADSVAETRTVRRESGFELPLPPGLISPEAINLDGRNPQALCVALKKALINGRGSEISAIRHRILEVGTSAVADVIELLNSGQVAVEIEAVRLLSQIGDADGLFAALDRLLDEPRTSLAYSPFLAAFADNGSNAVATALADALGRTQYAERRERILDLLYAMRGPAAVAALERAALNPTDEIHGQDAVDGIALRHDPSETESLAALLESEYATISEAAAYGLANVGSGEACEVLADATETATAPAYGHALASVSSSYAQEALLAMATDPSRSVTVRVSAIQSLSGHRGQRVETVLGNAMPYEQNTLVASEMQIALKTINNNAVDIDNSPVTQGVKGELLY